MRTSFTTNIAITFGTRVFLAGFQFFFRIGIALLIGPYNQGVFFWFLQTVLLFSTLINMGMGTSTVYYLSKESSKRQEIISSTTFFSLASGIFWIGISWILMSVFHVHYSMPLPFSSITIAVIIVEMLTIGYNILLGTGRSKIFNLITLLQVIIQCTLLILFLSVYSDKLNAAVNSYLFAVGFTLIVTFFLIFHKDHFKISFFNSTFGKQLTFGLGSWYPGVIYLVNLRLNFFMIQHFMGTSSGGIFSLSLMIAELLWFIPDSISTILLPAMSGSENKNIHFGNAVCRYTIIASSALLMFVAVSGTVLFLTFTNYRMSLQPFLLLLPGVFLFSICKLLSTLITANGKLAISNISSSIILIVNVTGCFLLIPHFGIKGAAIATSLGYLTGTAIAVFYYANLTKSKLSDFLIPKREDFMAILTRCFNILSLNGQQIKSTTGTVI